MNVNCVSLLSIFNQMHNISMKLPVAHTVGNVAYYFHVSVWLHYTVTSGHCAVREALLLPELRVSAGRIFHVVPKGICSRTLERG
jgi:hypothetical protein